MDYKEMINIFESRRENLSRLADSTNFTNSKDIEVQGALKELGIVINTLKQQRKDDFSTACSQILVEDSGDQCTAPGFFAKILSPIQKNESTSGFPD